MGELTPVQLIGQVTTDMYTYLEKTGIKISPAAMGKLLRRLVEHCLLTAEDHVDENTIRNYIPN